MFPLATRLRACRRHALPGRCVATSCWPA